jgi:cation transport ATPase
MEKWLTPLREVTLFKSWCVYHILGLRSREVEDATGRWMGWSSLWLPVLVPWPPAVATPILYAMALPVTAQRGIIIKGGDKLEAMGSVDRIVLKKKPGEHWVKGKFVVMHLEVFRTSKSLQEMLELLSLVQEQSSQPVPALLVRAVKNKGVKVTCHILLTNHSVLKEEGITAIADRKMYTLDESNDCLTVWLSWLV